MIRPVVDNIVDVIVASVRPQRIILFGSRARQNSCFIYSSAVREGIVLYG
ncbi:hypothetical protein MNBD_BACTEROID05-258 [hydrothermal vent metagenome]|uniref:Uncharacterized protein n=1 Tax=hydrothermal vent metagenome TaxID=652676 RepID=A0A3B0U436_9ZZZZ